MSAIAIEARVPDHAAAWFPRAEPQATGPAEPEAPTLHRAENHDSRGLLVVAGVSAVGALGLYAAAGMSRTEYDAIGSPRVHDQADLDALRKRTNLESAGALGLGVLSIGCGVGALVVGRF